MTSTSGNYTNIEMAPYEALYGRMCRSPICWEEVRERKLTGVDIIQIISEKVPLIKQRLETTFSRQKSYADPKKKEIEFQVGDYVFLKVSPMKSVIRFGKRGKLSPKYVGPYEIIERIGAVAYKLDLPLDMSQVHPVFHISMLRKYIADPSHVIQPQAVEVNGELSYEEQPVEIVDTQLRKLRTKEIPMVKVLWRNHSVEECTWETEADMRQRYPYLFLQGPNKNRRVYERLGAAKTAPWAALFWAESAQKQGSVCSGEQGYSAHGSRLVLLAGAEPSPP
ncbi:uncharacterized protein LOC126678232 [Mercurialis annua]|uniref:uncharacterized protein LOC126678232 n=1 Tax=Mercurialis annua TaxID=3986 RepID=UPI0024AFF902|nr:uncharacterized protein LOC126678232 [Mercurialis annua]